MGLLESLNALRKGAGRKVVDVPLLENEHELFRVIASRNPGTVLAAGGQLVLTNQRVVFSPWNTKDLSTVLVWGLGKAGAPKMLRDAATKLQGLIDASAIAVDGFSEVKVGSGASVLKPPTLTIVGADQEPVEFGILKSLFSPNFSKANESVRDQCVAIMNENRHP